MNRSSRVPRGLLLAAALLSTALPACRTAAPPDAGWRPLFDGTGFDGWQGFRGTGVPEKWTVDDGALHFDGTRPGSGGDLVTAESFEDFELALEWKIGPCGNSGIMYRVSPEFERTYESGPEYQVLDNSCHPDARNGLDRTAGANYALHAPARDVTKPAGQWNQTRILVRGPHVEHWLNGEKVVEYELWSDDWKRRVGASKFTEWPHYGMTRSGRIALQDHGDPVWYRNIRIRPL